MKQIHEQTGELALVLGYNELAKGASTIGQRVWMRMARDAAEARFLELGGQLNVTEPEKTILVLSGAAYVRFYPRDVEMMREAVRMFDAGELPMAESPDPRDKKPRKKAKKGGGA